MKQFIFLLFLFGVINNAVAMDASKFASILDISADKQAFGDLSAEDVKYILTNKKFKTDSEESVFAALKFWLTKERQKQFSLVVNADFEDDFVNVLPERKKEFIDIYVRPMLSYINFSRMTPYYLGQHVRDSLDEYDPQIYIDIIEGLTDKDTIMRSPLFELTSWELESQKLKDWESEQKYFNSSKINSVPFQNDDKTFGMMIDFYKISEWNDKEKYYSKNIHSNGLDFYFFARQEQNGLAGYVRCVGDTNNKNHLLPAEINISVVSPSNPDTILRKLPSQKIIFDHFDRSVGMFLTRKNDGETFEQLIHGKTTLTETYITPEHVLDHRMRIIVKIKYLDELPDSPLKDEFPLTINFEHPVNKPALENLSLKYVLEMLKRKLFAARSADTLFTMLSHWIKAQETKTFPIGGLTSADKAMQQTFINTYVKPTLALMPFNKMTPLFFDGVVENFMADYGLFELYAEKRSNYYKEVTNVEQLLWKDIRETWRAWLDIKQEWKDWDKKKEKWLKQNSGGRFHIAKPYFPDITHVTAMLKSDLFATDVEESVLYFALDYADQKAKRFRDLKPASEEEWKSFWSSIQWDAISPGYLDIISPMVKNINNPILQHVPYTKKRRRDENDKVGEGSRDKIKDSDKVMIKCIFQEVNNWELKGKYYSSPVLIKGFEIYYFLQAQPLDQNAKLAKDFGVAGFLRASMNIGGQAAEKINLPLTFDIVLQHPSDQHGNKERKFISLSVRFTDSTKAIGGKISLPNETWEKMINRNVPFVNKDDNTITAIVSLDFKTDGKSPKDFIE